MAGATAAGGPSEGCTHVMHRRSRMTIDPCIPTMPGRRGRGVRILIFHTFIDQRLLTRRLRGGLQTLHHPVYHRSFIFLPTCRLPCVFLDTELNCGYVALHQFCSLPPFCFCHYALCVSCYSPNYGCYAPNTFYSEQKVQLCYLDTRRPNYATLCSLYKNKQFLRKS